MIFDKLLMSPPDVMQIVIDSIETKKSLSLSYFNQHCFNVYYENSEYRDLLDSKFLVFQADLGVFLALKFFGQKGVNRIDATDMNKQILEQIIRRKISVTIIGGNIDKNSIQNEAQKMGVNLDKYFKGFFKNSEYENIICEINNLKSQVIFIGMGVPLQEKFAAALHASLNQKVIICVGDFLELYFGAKRRAPKFLQSMGCEWIYRMFSEPNRLWKRYLIGVPLFIVRVLRMKFS